MNRWRIPIFEQKCLSGYRRLLVGLFVLLSPSSCMLYDDFDLSGDYRLGGGLYYDGINYELQDYQGSMKLTTSSYHVSYSLTFQKKNGDIINETREERGKYRYTSESERTVYGSNEKFWSGLIFFYPDTLQYPGAKSYGRKYEYLIKSKKLNLDSSSEYSTLGYYTELEWVQK
jgi:hypothetical protein